jgi:hypothetical protein
LKVLTTLLILMITSTGCAINREVQPLCLPDRPELQSITVVEQLDIQPSVLLKIADNDLKLKSWVTTVERITEVHNGQFKAKCLGDTDLF